MPNFAYRALTVSGERVAGELEAADVQTAIARLQDSGLIPIDATPAGRADRRGAAPVAATRAVKHVTQLTRELATLLGAGQTVEGALSLAREEVPDKGLAAALEGVLLKVRSGSSLSDALAAEPRYLPAALCQPGARRRAVGPARPVAERARHHARAHRGAALQADLGPDLSRSSCS